jgi:hypothetical protein
MKYTFLIPLILILYAGPAGCAHRADVGESPRRPTNSSSNGESRETVAMLESRYNRLEKEYSVAKKSKLNLTPLAPIIEQIGVARKNRDLNRLSTLLDDFERALAKAYQAKNSPSPRPTEPKVDGNIKLQPSLENQALQKFSKGKYFSLLHAKKAPPNLVAENGAVGRNKRTFSDVATQRDALWLLRNSMIQNNQNHVSKAVQAFEYAFQHQTKAGNFKNGQGYDAVTAIGADAFFLYSYAHAYLLLKNDARFGPQFQRMKKLEPQLHSAVRWLDKNKAELHRQDGKTPNRLLFDAMAFYFASSITGATQYRASGREFLNQALASQKHDGSFTEKGGYDTSYQAVCMLNLSLLFIYLEDERLRNEIKGALDRASTWLAGKIASNGKVSAAGNTRTGLGQEIQSGKSKDINYPEVALSLYYSSVILNRPALATMADKVVTYADAQL